MTDERNLGGSVTFPRFKTPRTIASGARTNEAAEEIASKALLFLAEDPGRLTRFLSETGVDPDELRSSAGTPGMLAAVLDHVLRDESLLLVFAAGISLEPAQVAAAERALAGRDAED
jgi:hypothetical protein